MIRTPPDLARAVASVLANCQRIATATTGVTTLEAMERAERTMGRTIETMQTAREQLGHIIADNTRRAA